ncbi:MAG: hypothetical protein AAB525_02815 [Patescibacteria group bacterium]
MENSNEQSQGQTIKCPKCKEDIQLGAKKCKHCGADLRNWFVKHKIMTAILIIIGIGIIGSAMGGNETKNTSDNSSTANNSQEAKKEESKKEVAVVAPIKITAVDLAKAYEENEVKADKDYKDKKVEVTGKIKDIGVILDQTYVVLSSGKDFSMTDIQCFFDDKAQIDKVSELKKDATITVQGVVDGKSLNVGVKKCELR